MEGAICPAGSAALEKQEKKASDAVEEAVRFADESPEPTYDDLVSNIYA